MLIVKTMKNFWIYWKKIYRGTLREEASMLIIEEGCSSGKSTLCEIIRTIAKINSSWIVGMYRFEDILSPSREYFNDGC